MHHKTMLPLLLASVLFVATQGAQADGRIDTNAILGGAIGGGAGAAVGSAVGGRNGAMVGSAVGAVAGVAIATPSQGHREHDYWDDEHDRGHHYGHRRHHHGHHDHDD